MNKTLDALNELVEMLEKGQAARGKTLVWENLAPPQISRIATYDNKPINLHAKGKKLERELDNMEIWNAISK
jgi:hypothetical protein